jgi:5-methylcytosine-specific restriction protein A
MDFLSEYGEIGRGFIHVHHECPLANSDDSNGMATDPINDMKPVCPNCLAMLHIGLDARKGEVRTIEELRKIRELIQGKREAGKR